MNHYDRLTAQERELLDAPLTCTEVAATISSLNGNASPGSFGLDVHTLRAMCSHPDLLELITQLLNEWVAAPMEDASMFLALLSAIPKANKPPTTP